MSTVVTGLDERTRGVIAEAYRAFNARELEKVLATMQPNVEWANGMEGGFVHGHDGVREYWTRQWSMIDPHVEPVEITPDGLGRVVVRVHQVVRELGGKVLMDREVRHVYSFEDGQIRAMEIQE